MKLRLRRRSGGVSRINKNIKISNSRTIMISQKKQPTIQPSTSTMVPSLPILPSAPVSPPKKPLPTTASLVPVVVAATHQAPPTTSLTLAVATNVLAPQQFNITNGTQQTNIPFGTVRHEILTSTGEHAIYISLEPPGGTKYWLQLSGFVPVAASLGNIESGDISLPVIKEYKTLADIPPQHLMRPQYQPRHQQHQHHQHNNYESEYHHAAVSEDVTALDRTNAPFIDVCDVCALALHSSNDSVSTCSTCHLSVHHACYGLAYGNKGSNDKKNWTCTSCSACDDSKSSDAVTPPKCVFCDQTVGMMKKTTDGKTWAHMLCAFYLPNVAFLNTYTTSEIGSIDQYGIRGPISNVLTTTNNNNHTTTNNQTAIDPTNNSTNNSTNISSSSSSSSSSTATTSSTGGNINNCVVCSKSIGITIGCDAIGCDRRYHPRCAFRNSQLMFCEGDHDMRALFRTLCKSHTDFALEKSRHLVKTKRKSKHKKDLHVHSKEEPKEEPNNYMKKSHQAISSSYSSVAGSNSIQNNTSSSSSTSSTNVSSASSSSSSSTGMVSISLSTSSLSSTSSSNALQQRPPHSKRSVKSYTIEGATKEEEVQFFIDLKGFHTMRGTQMKQYGKELDVMDKLPRLGHKDVNLYLLFKHVVTYGGFKSVVENEGTWAKIFRQLPNYSPTETSASYRLKKMYTKYLLEYEQTYYNGKDNTAAVPSISKKRKNSMDDHHQQTNGNVKIKRRDISSHALLSGASVTMSFPVEGIDKRKSLHGSDALFSVQEKTKVEGFTIRGSK